MNPFEPKIMFVVDPLGFRKLRELTSLPRAAFATLIGQTEKQVRRLEEDRGVQIDYDTFVQIVAGLRSKGITSEDMNSLVDTYDPKNLGLDADETSS